MSLFPRSFQEFSPLFHLLEEYDQAERLLASSSPFSQSLRNFTPKFDIMELKDSYELHGEFPEIEHKDIKIEWTDGNTLAVSGRTEHRSESGIPPKGFIEGDTAKNSIDESHKSTTKDAKKTAITANTDRDNNVAKKPTDEGSRYWVTERSIGEFYRSFSFPTRVDQEGVKASLKNGILSITVPKAAGPTPRKITIE